MVGFTAYVYEIEDGAADVAEIQRRLEQAVGGPVTLRARVVSSKLELITDPVSEGGGKWVRDSIIVGQVGGGGGPSGVFERSFTPSV